MKNQFTRLAIIVFLASKVAISYDASAAKGQKPSSAVQETPSPVAPVEEIKWTGMISAKSTTHIKVMAPDMNHLTVVTWISHGTAVKVGELILQLKQKGLEDKIKGEKLSLAILQLEAKNLENELAHLELKQKTDLEIALRKLNRAISELEYFKSTRQEAEKRDALFAIQDLSNKLIYVKEELRQLERMYSEDDLVEETEEIIVKRQKDTVESFQHQLKMAEINNQKKISDLANELQELTEKSTELSLSHKRLLAEQPIQLAQKKTALDQASLKVLEKEKSILELENTQKALAIRATHDGILYHGDLSERDWQFADRMQKAVSGDVQLKDGETVYTIVPHKPELFIQLQVDSKQLAKFQSGMKCWVGVDIWPEKTYSAKVDGNDKFPISAGLYKVDVLLDPAEQLFAGMKAEIYTGE